MIDRCQTCYRLWKNCFCKRPTPGRDPEKRANVNIVDIVKAQLKNVKVDQDGLDLLKVNLRKDPNKSRLVVRVVSEIGVDLPGDAAESMIVGVADAIQGGTEGN